MRNSIKATSIFDAEVASRDLLVDELGDDIRAGDYSDEEVDGLLLSLIEGLSNEKNLEVRESIMNLLSELYPSVQIKTEIDEYILNNIHSMATAELMHAFSILSESAYEAKEDIFREFSKSDNPTVCEVAGSYLR